MVSKQKRLNELALLLQRPDAVIVTQAIELLREEEPFNGVIGLLADCYDSNKSTSVTKAIEGFMNDMKEKSLQPELMSEIRKNHKPATKGMLVASCWQSGIDYSEYCLDFAEAFLNNEYMVAIECLTVIEESSGKLDQKTKKEIIKLIDGFSDLATDEKKPLINELKLILSV
ncbi:MAG TPA: hypothetical protein VHO50_06895 [Bacteroidales bacterium]|nr:hypothetical protein [Bacteroidales bacterium]